MNPVTLEDLANFIYLIANAYEGYLFMAFTLMLASSVIMLVKKLLVGYAL